MIKINTFNIRNTMCFMAACSMLCWLTGCMSALKAVAPKLNVTQLKIENTVVNQSAVSNCINSVAKEFQFTIFKKDWDLSTTYLGYYLLDANSRTHAPYAIIASVERGDPSINSVAVIKDWNSLVSRLRNPAESDDVSRYLRTKLSNETIILLDIYSSENNAEVQKAIIRDIERVIVFDVRLYDKARFKSVKLSMQTLDLLKHEPLKGYDKYRLNRLLLQEAYPQEIAAMESDSIKVSLSHKNITGIITEKYTTIETRLTAKIKECVSGEVLIEKYREWIP